MERKKIFLAVVVFVFGCFVLAAEATIQPSFQGVGDLPGGYFWSRAYGVSADGSVVVGRGNSASGTEAFRWTSSGGMVGLGDLPGDIFDSQARGVSSDGSVVVGKSKSASGREAFRWENGQMVGLGDLPGGDFYSEAHGVSADGSVVVGYSCSALGIYGEAFRWTANDGMAGLGDLPGGIFQSYANGVSADGSVVVGRSYSASGEEAFRWQDLNGNGQVDPDEKMANHPEFGLGDLPGGNFFSVARGCSADGLVVVGWGHSVSGIEAFRWEDGEMVGLGDLPGGDFSSYAWDCSVDGSVVVGSSHSALGDEAFIWEADKGMRSLKDVLVNDYGLDLTGWWLENATGISADGLTIVGLGFNPAGHTEGWIATIPEPASIMLFSVGLVMMRRKIKHGGRK